MFMWPVFNVFGLSLRPMHEEDALSWLAYLQDPETVKLTGWDIDEKKELVSLIKTSEDTADQGGYMFALVQTETDELAGTIGLHTASSDQKSVEIAYDLRPEYWSKGIMTAVCNVVVNWTFTQLQFKRIQGHVLVGNKASARVLEKCGFTLEGISRETRFQRNQPHDFWVYSYLRSR